MLKKKIDDDLKEALKAKDAIKVSTLRLLKSAIKNLEIEKQEDLKGEDVVAVIKKQAKQRKDSIEEFKKADRQDLVEKEENELAVLKGYLPEELSQEELAAIVKAAIAQTGASSAKDMGLVIKEVMASAKGRADGKAVSIMVKEELSKGEGTGKAEESEDK